MNDKQRIAITFIIICAVTFIFTQFISLVYNSLDYDFTISDNDDNYPFKRAQYKTKLARDTYVTNFYDRETGVEYMVIIRGKDTIEVQPRSNSSGGVLLHGGEDN
jgi:hypothetical protein